MAPRPAARLPPPHFHPPHGPPLSNPAARLLFMPYNAGDKPGAGRYTCLGCGTVLVLEENTDTLPRCRLCRWSEYRKE